MGMALLVLLLVGVSVALDVDQKYGTWYTKMDKNGRFGFFNTLRGDVPQQLKGVSMTGWETGTRGTNSGGGYWLFDPPQPSVDGTKTIMKNLIDTLANDWKVGILRMPICGSGWLQNYPVRNWANQLVANYQDWVDMAVTEATSKGIVVIVDNHLWAIASETQTERNAGMEDGCTGINSVCVGTPSCINSCAIHDWYGEYTSKRTGKTYNEGDEQDSWQCSIANADGCSLDNIKRKQYYPSQNVGIGPCCSWDSCKTCGNTSQWCETQDHCEGNCNGQWCPGTGPGPGPQSNVSNSEHFYNLWYALADHYKGNSHVWFELMNEPYQRKSAKYNDPACTRVEPGSAKNCPPGTGFGDNLAESDYDWEFWSELMNTTIGIIRGQGAQNNILVSGLDWNYDFYGDGTPAKGGPIPRPELMPWVGGNVPNVGYSYHPYQHGSCCGEIGDTSDLSKTDPYQSAFCMYPPSDKPSGSALPIPQSVVGGHSCDDTGYAPTSDKKSPPCVWAPQAKGPKGQTGVCAGARDKCGPLTEAECNAMQANSSNPAAGGWSQFVLPMQKYGPLVATEFGPFDCSSPFTENLLKYNKQYGISYTAWALWPQNSGGPGAGGCGYPTILTPTGGPLDDSNAFGKGQINCLTTDGCSQLLKPQPWSGALIHDDIASG